MAIMGEKSSSTLASFIIILPAGAEDQLLTGMEALHAVVAPRFAYHETVLVDDSGGPGYAAQMPAVLAQFPFVNYVRLSRSFGDEIASYAGLDQAIGDHVAVALLGQDPMVELPALLARCQTEDRIVFGRATNKPAGGLLRKLGQRAFKQYTTRTMHVELDQGLTRLVAMPRAVVNSLLKLRDPSGYLGAQTGYIGLNTLFHDYALEQPQAWHAHESLSRSLSRGMNIVAQNSVHPLRFLTWISAVGGLFNLLYLFFIIAIWIFHPGRPDGWVALSAQQCIYFFFICAFFIVVSEYLGQIMITVKGRPLYFVIDQRHSNVLAAMDQKRNVVDE